MTELVWDGKYNSGKRQAPVKIALPFQTIETVNESAQDRQRSLELFSAGRETEWRNRLIWGDNKYVLPSVLAELQGKVNLIYIDPPFSSGQDFSFIASIPATPEAVDTDGATFTKEPSILEQKAYRDTWGRGLDSYLQMMYERLLLMRDLLTNTGCLLVHLDETVSHYMRAILDDLFGADNYVNSITWRRSDAHSDIGQGAKHLGRICDTIFLYSRTPGGQVWNMQYTPLPQSTTDRWYRHVEEGTGRRYNKADITGPGGATKGNPVYEWKGITRAWRFSRKRMEELDAQGRIVYSGTGMPYLKRYLDESKGVPLQDLWTDIEMLRGIHSGSEFLGYKTQKPEALLKRIVTLCSNENDLVGDFFCGSGTTLAVAEKLGRRWIGCDLSRFAIHTTRKRLLALPGLRPFVVQNLGKYERQAWQAAEFPVNSSNRSEGQNQREASYRQFILDLYHADPLVGHPWLHGTRRGRMVHVGAVDAPVTLADVKAIAKEAWRTLGSREGATTQAAVDILGWDFAFELNELAKQVAAQSRVDVAFKKIPREVLDNRAVEQGDIRFFELGALAVDAKARRLTIQVKLKDFVIPTDDIPEEARAAIKHWSQLIDYWAVDWDNKNDTFHNEWQTYRTRKSPGIELEASHKYEQSGKHTVVVKVIDILGNDTTKTIDVTIKDA